MAVTRITGMASGMDIDSLVKKMVQADSQPLNKMNQNKQLMEWKREGYRETSVKLVTFAQTKINDTFSKLDALNAQKATVSGNTTAVSAKAGSSAGGIMDITVNKLATAATTKSSAVPTQTGTETDWSKVLLSDIDGSGVSGTGTVAVKVNGVSISIDAATETVESFVNKINSTSQAGVTAVFDSATGKMSITSKATGTNGNNIALEGDVFTTGFKLASQLSGGSDASVNINGLDVTKSSNNFLMNGVEITLNSTSKGESTHIEVSKDVDKIVDTVQSFVDSYNELLSFMNGKVNEEKYSKYAPLTSDQKKDMSDDEVKLWETKAKSGMLKRDSMLTSAISDMRTAMIQTVHLDSPITLPNGTQTSELSMANLGITTGTYETRGKLILDKDKLKAAIEDNPDIVNNFLGKNYSSSYLNNEVTASDGIFSRLRKISNKTLDSLAKTAGTSKVSTDLTAAFNKDSIMGETLRLLDIKIDDFQDRLDQKETNYYKKFSAMETAISKYNTTSNSLFS
ncbi:flagellar filament capping protein FliD [Paenibacillus polymyxa]|uniref:flagellar filament capping protein FliD n=1 Tax=Paenibacillus polymyxa TaxID=1406 RepID=UPI0023F79E2A|nr:flagellar filament capping protein FliD [Paenibacillus polymyxa]